MTELRATKANVVAVEQTGERAAVRKANVVAVEQTGALLTVRKANVYVVEQPVQDAQVVKTNVVVVEQPIPDAKVHKATVYVVEQQLPDMFYRVANAGDTPGWYDVTVTAPPAWWKISPWVNIGAYRETEDNNRRITEDGNPRRVEAQTPVETWVEPLATYVKWQGEWHYVRGPNSPLDEP